VSDTGGILVIKLGALGDMVQATGPFAAIRKAHDGQPITLLTTPPFETIARAGPWFDRIWTNGRPAGLKENLRLIRQLRAAGFARVYDLQTSDRSSRLFHFLRPRPPEWSGIAWGASHRHKNPGRDRMHTLDRQRDQLRVAGILDVPAPDLSFAQANPADFGLSGPFALLVPGGSAHRPAKRWPAARYGAIARHLLAKGIMPAIIGHGAEEQGLAQIIAGEAPGSVDLTGRTRFLDIAGLARQAVIAIGNDTGPMHLAAAAGAPALVLFSHESDPALCAPRGPRVRVLRQPDLADLTSGAVLAALDGLMPA